jgi:hypothetical protein
VPGETWTSEITKGFFEIGNTISHVFSYGRQGGDNDILKISGWGSLEKSDVLRFFVRSST